MKKSILHSSGFTIIELLITISIFSILAGLSLPAYNLLQKKNNIDIAKDTVVDALQQARMLAQASKNDSSWSVKIENGAVTIFAGANFANRDINSDQIFGLPMQVNVSGLSEVGFSKLFGLPQTFGTVTLLIENETKQITINEKGRLDY